MADTRIVHGARCAWWDSIDKVGMTPPISDQNLAGGRVTSIVGISLPCCPHCKGVLMELPDEATWWRNVDAYEQAGHAGYRDFVKWLRGKCFAGAGPAFRAYTAETGKEVANVHKNN